jgi:hypothetical protein
MGVTGQSSLKITLRPSCLQVGFSQKSNLIFRNIEKQCCTKRVVTGWQDEQDLASMPTPPPNKKGFYLELFFVILSLIK